MGESGTHRTRPSPGPIRTDMSRTWISILNSTQGTSPTIGLFSTHPRTLTFRLILTPSVFLSQKSSLISKHALPQDGVRTSLELLETTRWFSRRSTYQLSATTSARPPSGPPDLAKGSSSTIRLSALVELTARTPAREMVEVPSSARASLTQLPTSRQEEGCCSGQGAQGTGDSEQVQPVQRLLAAHRRCSPDHGWQWIC